MAIDRAAILRNAEKLLRQGKLMPAIAEYVRIVEDQPRDWNSANALGDLYVRAKQLDKAIEQFTRIADTLNDEGFLPKAGALYKKVLKVKPDHEHALMQSAEIAATQGVLVDARSFLRTLADLRRARGDARGVAQIAIRLGSLDPADYDARLAAARARIEVGDVAGALGDFKDVAAELVEKNRPGDARAALEEAGRLAPDDADVRARLLDVYLAAGEFARARECAATPAQLKAVAARLEEAGEPGEALLTLREAARLDPADAPLRMQLVRTFVARGDMTAAAEYLSPETAGDDPELLVLLAGIHFRAGRTEEGLGIVRPLLERDPSRRQDVALLGLSIADTAPDAGYQLTLAAADVAASLDDWASAAAGLQEFVTRVPNHIPALMRLIEICVDGALEATLYSAQAQLADAYIQAGSAAEARFIAEDLVAREPWDRANIERFRKALVLMGEPNPDEIIADRLSGESPFTSTDESITFDDLPEPVPSVAAAAAVVPTPAAQAVADHAVAPAPAAAGVVPAALAATGPTESFELDLNQMLERTAGEERKPQALTSDIDDVFAQLRDEAAAAEEFKRGVTLFESGDIDGAIKALESASRAPRLRFATASRLGRIHRVRGDKRQAIEWLERAAQATAPSPDEGHRLLYELAELLESTGDLTRALAVCMELQADAGEYRDVGSRVDRLARVQTRG